MMRDLSMHILDIVQNSIKAEAHKIEIEVEENTNTNRLCICIKDNGGGMSKEMVETVRNPFTTTRTTRKVGLGIPMLEQTCLQCGGQLLLESELGVGTVIKAEMEHNNIDRPPLGDIISSIFILIITNQDMGFLYKHTYNDDEFVLDMDEIREILGDVPLDTPDVSSWLKEHIAEGVNSLYQEEQ